MTPIPKGFRRLRVGEILRCDDKYYSIVVRNWRTTMSAGVRTIKGDRYIRRKTAARKGRK